MQTRKKNKPTQPAAKTFPIWIVLGLLVVLIAAAVVLLQNRQNDAADSSTTLPREVSVQQAKELVDSGALLLDVREPSEWNELHVPGATLIPLGELAGRVSEVPQDQQVVVLCRSGNRSQQGRDILLNAGYKNVTSVSGGILDWQANNYPTVSGP